MPYRAEIDGLRALCISAVMLFHAEPGLLPGGFAGVDIFFVLSGYLITGIIATDLAAGRFSLAHFYERRVRRILPALFFVLACTLPIALAWLPPADLRDFGWVLFAAPLIHSNQVLLGQAGYFDAAAELKPLLHLWSLSVEEQYYLVFPLAMAGLWRAGRAAVIAALALVWVASIAAAAAAVPSSPDAVFFSLHTRAWELATGALLALLPTGHVCTNAVLRTMHQGLALAGLLALVASFALLEASAAGDPGQLCLPVLGAALVLAFSEAGGLTRRVLQWRPLVFLGLISYSAYLWHQPVFSLARHRLIEPPTAPVLLALAVLTLLLATLSWHTIERPFRDRSRRSFRQVLAFTVPIGVALCVAGLVLGRSEGWPQRYSGIDRENVEQHSHGRAYVTERFKRLRDRPFDAGHPGRRVLLVGDSYAQDLVNAVHEGGLERSFQLRTHYIGARCGNLALAEPLTPWVDAADRETCPSHPWHSRALHGMARQADEIWLASYWKPWQVELLPRSLMNLEQQFAKPIRVFGRKGFGEVRITALLALPLQERLALSLPVAPEQVQVNDRLAALLPADGFIDSARILCGEASRCRPFTDEGLLASYDGAHLTRAGARLFGMRLRPLLARPPVAEPESP